MGVTTTRPRVLSEKEVRLQMKKFIDGVVQEIENTAPQKTKKEKRRAASLC